MFLFSNRIFKYGEGLYSFHSTKEIIDSWKKLCQYICSFIVQFNFNFRLKNHYSNYEPTLRQLKTKYESAMKEKMLTKLERDRAVGQVAGLQSTLKNMEGLRVGSGGTKLAQCKSFTKLRYCLPFVKFEEICVVMNGKMPMFNHGK